MFAFIIFLFVYIMCLCVHACAMSLEAKVCISYCSIAVMKIP